MSRVGSSTTSRQHLRIMWPLLCPLPPPLSGWLPYSLTVASRKGSMGLEKHVVQDQMFGFSKVCCSLSPLCSVTPDHGEYSGCNVNEGYKCPR